MLSFSSSPAVASPQDDTKPFHSSLALAATDGDTDANTDTIRTPPSNRLDQVLSRLTLGFPLYVVLAAMVGLYQPSWLDWVNRGSLISLLLAGVMCGTGLTLTSDDFRAIPPRTVALGVACQFGIMPAAAWMVGKVCLQPSFPELFLGLCLVGCSPGALLFAKGICTLIIEQIRQPPGRSHSLTHTHTLTVRSLSHIRTLSFANLKIWTGGTASNLVSLIANADVALSVVLTACSTILAVLITPALVKLLVSASSNIDISGFTLVLATAKVVLGPVVLGMLLKAKAPTVADSISRYTPFASTLLVALICGGVVAQNAPVVLAAQVAWLPRVLLSVFALHSIGFAAGYLVPRYLLSRTGGGDPPTSGSQSNVNVTSRTISIEVGMQNSALAVVLARSLGGPATLAALPGALSATVHSCLGSVLAALWRRHDERPTARRQTPRHVDPEIHPTYGPQDPEFSI